MARCRLSRVAEHGLAELGIVPPDFAHAVPAGDKLVVQLGPVRGNLPQVFERLRDQPGVERPFPSVMCRSA